MRVRAVLGALAIVIGYTAPAALAEPRPTTTIGGGGGSPFSSYCGPTAYMTRVDARAGAWIDGVYAICGVLGADNLSFVSNLYPSYVGGGGGAAPDYKLNCPDPHQVVTQLEVEVVHVGGATYVSNLWVDCMRIGNPADRPGSWSARNTPNAPDATYERRGFVRCPEGQWAVGLQGRAGIYIDSIGLLCDYAPGHSAIGDRVNDAIQAQPCAFCETTLTPLPQP